MAFLQNLIDQTNKTTTTNGAVTHMTSNSHVLDYFAQGSALRNRDEESMKSLFNKSFAEDPLLTMKILFYSRDIRGGQGERSTFNKLLKYASTISPDAVRKNLHLISEYGRWDDLFCLIGTALEDDMFNLIEKQLKEDIKSEYPSLLAKWLKSENTSSLDSRRIAVLTAQKLNMSPRVYRKTLSALRKKINIVETHISNKNYSVIDYSKLPAKAAMIYRKSFFKYDKERYIEYLENLKKNDGTVKVNAASLFPYEIVEKVYLNYSNYDITEETKVLMDSMWKALPDYINGNNLNGIVVADTSGSMHGKPILMSISLALYLAERNSGPYKNHFITFSETPKLQEVIGTDLYSKVNNLSKADWGNNTNIEAVFDLILNTAIQNKVSNEDIPKKIFIVSDMEFDACSSSNSYKSERFSFYRNANVFGLNEQKTLFEEIKKKYEDAGYSMPGIVFWNVNSIKDNIPMAMSESGVQLVSGANPVLFETLLANQFIGAYELMLKEIGKPRYDSITV